MKKIFTIILLSALCLSMPVESQANEAVEIIEQQFQGVRISVSQSTLHVTGANNQMLYVYNVTGVRVMALRVEGNDKFYNLNLPKGCYIVKVGRVVRKISIR